MFNKTCIRCDNLISGCYRCSNSTFCIQCYNGYYLSIGKCVNFCPQNYYPNVDGNCTICMKNCKVCSSSYCYQCLNGYYLWNGNCWANNCPFKLLSGISTINNNNNTVIWGTYFNSIKNKCIKCSIDCIVCIN